MGLFQYYIPQWWITLTPKLFRQNSEGLQNATYVSATKRQCPLTFDKMCLFNIASSRNFNELFRKPEKDKISAREGRLAVYV